jgi:hypothetical protein
MTPEEENTFRVLKDEDPIVTSMWCWWGLHKWTKWDNSNQSRDYRDSWVIQRKTCVHCNDFKERKKFLK